MSISIKLNDAHQVFRTFQNGQEVVDEIHSPQTVQELSSLLADRCGSTTPQRPPRSGPDKHQIPLKTGEYLDLAEAYTQTEDDLERARAQQSPPLLYRDLEAAQGFDRQDRMAYTVRVDDFEDSEYGINKKIQIEQPDGTSLATTVLAADRSSEGNTLGDLLSDMPMPVEMDVKLTNPKGNGEFYQHLTVWPVAGNVPQEAVILAQGWLKNNIAWLRRAKSMCSYSELQELLSKDEGSE